MIKFLRRNQGMNCEEIMVVLQGYLDGVVDEQTAREVASHLSDCAICAPEAVMYTRIKDSLSGKQLSVDPDVLAGLHTFGERVAQGEFEPDS